MAIDTPVKRAAVPGAGRPWMRSQSPVAGKTREWRASVGNAYPVANFQDPSGVAEQLLSIGSNLTGGTGPGRGGMLT